VSSRGGERGSRGVDVLSVWRGHVDGRDRGLAFAVSGRGGERGSKGVDMLAAWRGVVGLAFRWRSRGKMIVALSFVL
jgi:hypothetical protein